MSDLSLRYGDPGTHVLKRIHENTRSKIDFYLHALLVELIIYHICNPVFSIIKTASNNISHVFHFISTGSLPFATYYQERIKNVSLSHSVLLSP